MTDPRAGQPAAAEDLVDVAKLVTAYYAVHPDPGDAEQRVSFGTSGHRGSAFTATFNEDHILATTQAICEYRAAHGIDGPLYLGADTHALSEPAQVSALEVLAANEVRVMVDARGGYTPTPAVSRAILAHNASSPGPSRRRDRGHALAQPAAGRRVQVQPARRRPGRHRYHQADPGPGERTAGRRAEGGAPGPVRPGGADASREIRLPRQLRGRPRAGGGPGRDQGSRGAHRRRPARRGERGLLGRDRRPLRPGPDRRQPGRGRHVPVHDLGLGRQDPDGLLVAVRHGQPDRPAARVHRSRPGTTPTPTGTASSRPTPGCSTPTTTSRWPSTTCTGTGTAGRPPPLSGRPWSAPR